MSPAAASAEQQVVLAMLSGLLAAVEAAGLTSPAMVVIEASRIADPGGCQMPARRERTAVP
jgi:hypothetical protein